MDKLNLEIGWDIDNNQLKAGLDQARKNIEGVGQTIEVVEEKVNNGFQSNIQQVNLLAKNYDMLKKEAEEYAKIVATSFDPTEIAAYNAKLVIVREEMAKIKAMGLDLPSPTVPAQKWNSLQNSINQISRELPAFTYSIQTGFMAISNNLPMLFDDIGKLTKENEALLASGKKGVPVWKQVASSLFSWNTLMSVGITLLTVYGKEIGAWVTSLFMGKKGLDALKLAQEALTKAMDDNSFSKAIQDVDRLRNAVDMAKQGFVSKKSVVEEYNKTIGQATGEVKTLDEVEKFLIANADNYIKMMMYKAAANLALADAAKEAIEAEKIRIKELKEFEKTADQQIPVGTGTSGYVTETDIKNAKYNAKKLAEARKEEQIKVHADAEQKQLDISNNFMRKAQDYASKMKISVFGDGPKKEKDTTDKMENLFDQIVNGREEMLNKILLLDKEYARKSMASDAAEVQALKDKFAEFRRIIAEENEKIKKYNDKNRDKKGFQAVDLIDVSKVDPIEKRAGEQLAYNQSTAKTIKEIEEKKKLFSEYESYVAKLGKEKADAVYKDKLGGFEKYVDYIQSVAIKEADAINAVTTGTATDQQSDRAKAINKEKDEAVAAEKKKQTEVLALMLTYDQQRKNLIAKYEADRATQVQTATAAELAEFDRKHTEELHQLDDANIERLQSVKNLFNGIERLTDAQARKVISDIQTLLNSGVEISPEMLKKIRETLKDTTKALDARLPDRVMQLSSAFSQMGQELSGVNEGLGSMLSGMGNILAASVQIGDNFTALNKGLENYKKYKDDKEKGAAGGGGAAGLLGGISAIAGVAGPIGGIVSAVAGVASGVVKFFGAAKESARQAEKQLKEYQAKIIEGELEYNRLIRERARSQKSVNDMTLEELKLQKELLKTQLEAKELRDFSYEKKVKKKIGVLTLETIERVDKQEVLSDYEYALQKILDEGTEVVGKKKEKYGGILGIGKKTRLVDVTASLAGKTYEDLERLYTEGKMNDATKALFENLQKAKKEVDDINELMKEIDEQIMDKMSGSVSASSISSSIIQGFKDGKRAVVDFAGDAEEIIQNALLSAMSATVLEEPLQELVKSFREDAKDGLSESEILEFKKAYGDVVKSGIDAMKEIDKLTGGKIGSSSPTGRINSSITETTGSNILGFERARYELAKQQLAAVVAALDFEKKSYEQILESVRYLKSIEQHTKDTVAELKNAVVELKAINKNTTSKSGRTAEGMGL